MPLTLSRSALGKELSILTSVSPSEKAAGESAPSVEVGIERESRPSSSEQKQGGNP